MTVTLTYDDQLSRVRITADGLGPAVAATVERSTNQITWSTVRGGLDVPVVDGAMQLDDYEFVAGQENIYRVRYADTITFVGVGAAAHADNAAVNPGLPAGLQEGDLLVELTAIRNVGGVADVPTGYVDLWTASNLAVRGKTAGPSEVAPTQTFTGGVVGASTSAQLAAFRGCSPQVGAIQVQVNATTQNIASPGLTPQRNNSVLIYAGWKQDDWTSVTVPGDPVVTEIGEPSTTLGDDQGIAWGYLIQTDATEVGASAFVVTGGAPATSYAVTFELSAAELTQTGSITPTLDGVWLKFIARPFLNTMIDAYGDVNVTRKSRTALHHIVGRTAPIGVTDVRAGREFELAVKTLTPAEYQRLDLATAGGDPIYVHAPAGSPVPSMYAIIGDTLANQPTPGAYLWVLPLTEVAAPGPDVVGSTATYQTVVNTYATYADLLAAQDTYLDVLDLLGQPDEVIVP